MSTLEPAREFVQAESVGGSRAAPTAEDGRRWQKMGGDSGRSAETAEVGGDGRSRRRWQKIGGDGGKWAEMAEKLARQYLIDRPGISKLSIDG